MFALLSPTCIPLHSFNFTYSTLIHNHQSNKKSFIEILNNEPGAYDRWLARGPPDVMLPDVPFRNFRVGSQFFILTRRHAKLVVKDTKLWMKFKLPCVRDDVCYPEEHYFATLFNIRDPNGCVPATLTHVDWNGRSDGHPRTYQASEVGPELIFKLRHDTPRYGDDDNGSNGGDLMVRRKQYPFLFARKFSLDCLEPLMSIANDVIFKE
ncbi:Core-2/I-branching beta-1,6-N-acetylglucosaminyltransferase family protein [Thalictrum thalictroides]|uniref:Core-2/I-branching beta-1,6-N-acetylglucosaminyltransferase family protein n=1 Tax=Thalictrum thalictroides TaxID=46969 RepID=A0A7J6XH33_THATH|nr:Core-2/I-branching beta-1,6-N-acetylglucosaminyltransferase family protein [Thalictrum thalictroides]